MACARKIFALYFAAAGLAGCVSQPPAVFAASPPKNYPQLAADYLNIPDARFEKARAVISSIEPTTAIDMGDWKACVKNPTGQRVAVFYRDGGVSFARTAVVGDSCDKGTGFRPLPKPTKVIPKEGEELLPAKKK